MKESERVSRRATKWRPLVLVAAVIAFAGALAITSGYGPGLDPDSMAYAGAAASLAHGSGLRVPIGKWQRADSTVELTVWPPGLSTAIAIPEAAGIPAMWSARLVLALSGAATAALIAAIFTGAMPVVASAIGVAIVLVTPSFVEVHLSLLSEPLFIGTLALTLFGMIRGRMGVAAIGATLAVLTRYVGASAAMAAAIWFLFFETGSLKRRLARAALASAPAAAAFTLWMIHNSRVPLVQSAITVGYHPGIASTLGQGLQTLVSWSAPGLSGPFAAVTAGALAVAVGSAIAGAASHARRTDSSRATAGRKTWTTISTAAGVLAATYLFVLVCSRLFVGGAIEFDGRILAPAIFLFEAAIIPIVAAAVADRGGPVRMVTGLVAVLWIAAAIVADTPPVIDAVTDGNDFAASEWRESDTIRWVESTGRNHPVYTNWPAAVYFDAHRNAFDIPTSADSDTLALFGRMIAERGGFFVAFNSPNSDYPSPDSVAAGAHLKKIKTLSDGIIWGDTPAARPVRR